ncbi:MAG TPA: cytochrome P460 family protein [Candidatus Dormibacteraeota bacterium]|nr:cytochrome P460 family protein [Candidatus Dormibacteraeota bacterium]
MRKGLLLAALVLLAGTVAFRVNRSNIHAAPAAAPTAAAADGPQFDSDGSLMRPEGYRRSWIFLSSGFGMSYTAGMNGSPQFTNVFVNPSPYDYFVANGRWPDKTMFVLEEYDSTSHGSINKSGSYQQALGGLVVEVKDEQRFPDKWAYFGFGDDGKTAKAMAPAKNACWKCHEDHAAVEHSFVQFYPEMLKIAQAKGTIKAGVQIEK